MPGLLARYLETGMEGRQALTANCLDRIGELDPEIHAWVEIAPQPALGSGALDGVPFGVKDIFETRGMATEYGWALYTGRKGEHDAALVDDLRRRGAILLGKTETAAFAYFDPPPTRNPRDLARTPGGSSSGSAAAVAAAMVPFALGTQTQGSILRPASYCGICGFKPAFGTMPLEGVLPFAPSLDTIGLFTETAQDMLLLWQAIGRQVPAAAAARLAYASDTTPADLAPALHAAAERLRGHGFAVDEVRIGESIFEPALAAVRAINDYEGARTHEQRWREHGRAMGAKLAELVERGLAIERTAYEAALDALARARSGMAAIFGSYPVVITAAATGAAPLGLQSTGDPRMNAPFTGLGGPAIAVPIPVSGPPLGLQLAAAPGEDAMLLETAAAVETAFGR